MIKNESNHAWYLTTVTSIGGQSGNVTTQRVANSCQSTAWRLKVRLVMHSCTRIRRWCTAHPRGMWSGACGACNAARAGRVQFLTAASQGDSSPWCRWKRKQIQVGFVSLVARLSSSTNTARDVQILLVFQRFSRIVASWPVVMSICRMPSRQSMSRML